MPKQITSDQVVAAAEGLGKAEFTRGDLAQKLGVEKPKKFSQGFRQARRAGRLDKVRDDEEGTGHFRLTDGWLTPVAPAGTGRIRVGGAAKRGFLLSNLLRGPISARMDCTRVRSPQRGALLVAARHPRIRRGPPGPPPRSSRIPPGRAGAYLMRVTALSDNAPH